MYAARKQRTTRRGLASLEFVLAFPIMLLFASAVLWVGRAGIARTKAAVESRNQVWASRPNARPTDALSANWGVGNGAQSKTVSKTYKGWFSGAANPPAKSKHTLFAGTWDHRSLPFEPKRGLMTPHLSVMGKIGTGANIGGVAEDVLGTGMKALEFLLTNQAVIIAGKVANGIVRASGIALEVTVLPLKAIRIALKIANLNPFVSLGKQITLVEIMLNSIDGLIESSKEREGSWPSSKLQKLTKFFDL